MNENECLLEIRELEKTFYQNGREIKVLKKMDLAIRAGETVSITGASGVGKSTLLQIMGTLDRPTAGSVKLEGKEIFSLTDADLALLRNQKVGFVFQFHHLLPEFSALENTMMPALIARRLRREAEESAREILCRVGLGERLSHRVGELSGGEQQRVAIARALVQDPVLLLADEPTGNLDRETGETIRELFLTLNREKGVTLVVATHNLGLIRDFDRRITLIDGKAVLMDAQKVH